MNLNRIFLAISLLIPIFNQICNAQSHTVVPLPIVRALSAAEDFAKAISPWSMVNEEQRYFMGTFYTHRSALSHFGEEELQAWASKNADELNAIAKSKGFDIQLAPFVDEEDFGVLSILDITLSWIEKGDKTKISYNNQTYPAVKLVARTRANLVSEDRIIAEIPTNGPDIVFMTIADEPLEGFALVEKISQLQKRLRHAYCWFSDIIFPMVHLNQKENIGWLLGMGFHSAAMPYHIAQALQQTKLAMDENGAHVESAVMIGIVATSVGFEEERKPIVIDKPFYMWIERKGCPIPILYGYIDVCDWKSK